MKFSLNLFSFFIVTSTLLGCNSTSKTDPVLEQFFAVQKMTAQDFENAIIANPNLGQIRSNDGISLLGTLAAMPISTKSEPITKKEVKPDGTVITYVNLIKEIPSPVLASKKENLIRIAIKNGADTSGTGMYSPSNIALDSVAIPDVNTVKLLHELGVPLDPYLYRTAIEPHTSLTTEERIEFIEYLSDSGVSPNSYKGDCQNIMHSAVLNMAKKEVMVKLVSLGADVNHLCNGSTPLDYAMSPTGPDFSASTSILRFLGAKTARELNSSSGKNNGLEFGQVVALAAIGHMATSSGLSAEQQVQVLTAATNDIVLNKNGNELNTLANQTRVDIETAEKEKSFKNNEVEAVVRENINPSSSNSKVAAASSFNSKECQSMQSSIELLKSSKDESIQSSVNNLMASYQKNCHQGTQNGLKSPKPNYFESVGKGSYFECGVSNEDQVELLCLNSKSYYLEYVKQFGKGADNSTIDGLFNAHDASAKLYLKALSRLAQ